MIEAHQLSMTHGSILALRDASLTVTPGTIVALLGPNGAGKTTFLRILATALIPRSGWARICGFDTVRHPLEVRRRIGYLPEHPPLDPTMEVEAFIDFVGRAHGLRGERLRQRRTWVMERTELGPRRAQPIGQLSKGYRQRVALAQALIHDPQVLLLDEPTTGLDPVQIRHIRSLIRELAQTKTVLFSTHILQEAEALADRIAIIAAGSIQAEGTRAELAVQTGLPSQIFATLQASMETVTELIAPILGLTDPQFVPAPNGTQVVASAADPKTVCQAIGAAACQRGIALSQLEARLPDLETIFIHSMNQRPAEAFHA